MSMFEEVLEKHKSNPESYPYDLLRAQLVQGLSLFWNTASAILAGSGVILRDPPSSYFSLEKNFFTMLFLYSYYAAGIPSPRHPFLVAVIQCLRGMVTGCDNILDSEYKQTLDTDLPVHGTRFRSVLDIMVSDRVLFRLLLDEWRSNRISVDQVQEAAAASLRALTASGVQEASEEGGVQSVLAPEAVLKTVHHYKTGLLFQCPWAVPAVIETIEEKTLARMTDALYRIGMGCQIMDDMVDFAGDLRQERHNYVVSLIVHGDCNEESTLLQKARNIEMASGTDQDLLSLFPVAQRIAVTTARTLLQGGAQSLYNQGHRFLVEPTIAFIAAQIGANRYLYPEMMEH